MRSSDPVPQGHVIQIDLVKVRAHLSRLRRRIVGEADAREWLVRGGFMPTRTAWRGLDAAVRELERVEILPPGK